MRKTPNVRYNLNSGQLKSTVYYLKTELQKVQFSVVGFLDVYCAYSNGPKQPELVYLNTRPLKWTTKNIV
jgi:hypothetical protein